MVNQDPQPEVFTSNHVYAAATAANVQNHQYCFHQSVSH